MIDKAIPASALFMALGCAEVQEPTINQTSENMIGGQPSPSGTDDDAVLLLRATADGEVLCTATLVAPNLVLTARHCVAFGGPPIFQCTAQGELIENAYGGGTLGADYPPESIELYSMDPSRDEPTARGKQIVSTQTNTICTNDIAFVVLDRELSFAPRAVRLDTSASVGEAVTLVGYGATVTGEKLDYKTQIRRRVSGQEIRDVGPDSSDGPILLAPPRTVLLEGPSACGGDSGGPAWSDQTGAVVGVFSVLGGDDCSANELRLFYTHTAPFDALAQQAFGAANAEPLPELWPSVDAGVPDAGAPDAGSKTSPSESESGCKSSAQPANQGLPGAIVFAGALLALRERRRNRT